MGTMTGTNRWWSNPTRKRCCSSPPTGSRPHIAASPVRSAAARTPRKCASRGPGSHQRGSNAGLVLENPCARASPAGPKGTPRCRASFSIGQLGERHGPVLFGTWKCLHRVVAMVTRDNPRERAPGQAIHQLREQRLSGVHGRASPEKARGNRHQLQIDTTKNRWKTLIGQPLLSSSLGVSSEWGDHAALANRSFWLACG